MKKRANLKHELGYVTFKTAAGWVGIVASAQGCSRVTFPQKTEEQAIKALGDMLSRAAYSPEKFEDLRKQFETYFRGIPTDFSHNLDLSEATPFERAVWDATCSIPHGQTRSYAWIARQIGKPQAPRAVGQALGRNPLPIIIPCHRVVTSGGKLGGFGGGLEMKQFLLDLEARK